jgi:hypothetical protein
MSLHHIDGPECPLCAFKLSQAHPEIARWFATQKTKRPHLHVSWSYRGQADQDRACDEGKSKLRYPDSKHNKTRDGKPCAEALDLFWLEDGVATFPPLVYRAIHEGNLAEAQPIAWGGLFKFRDYDHFELRADVLQSA